MRGAQSVPPLDGDAALKRLQLPRHQTSFNAHATTGEPMRRIFLDADRRLRNGWWLLVFIGCIAITRVAYPVVTSGLKGLGLSQAWLEPAPFVFIMLATWACLRLRRETFADVGFRLGPQWLRQFGAGSAVGVLMMVAIAVLMWAAGGVRFELDPAATVLTLGRALYVFVFVALFEEVLFRGFAFQRLVDGLGARPALLLVALLFALGHFDNPGMEGATRVWATIDLMLGALLLGLAYLRTRSLALPVGLHLGWNWAQGALLGFGVSGFEQTGWLAPVFQGKREWLTGGAFGPESSLCAVVVDLIALALLWRWRGTLRPPAPSASATPAAVAVGVA